MHPRSLPVVDAPVVLDALVLADALAAGLVTLLTLDVLLPQAATSRHVLAAAAAAIKAVCLLTVCLHWARVA
jgi:hypothetical protein